jgi:outer membrane protein assembly factor BamB
MGAFRREKGEPMENSSYKKIACPSCHAPLLVDPGDATTRCTFCGLVIQWPKQPNPPQPAPKTSPSDSAPNGGIQPPVGSYRPARAVPALILFLSLGGVAALGLIVCLVIGLGTTRGVLAPALSLTGPSVLLDTGSDSPPDVIALGYDSNADKYQLARFSPARRKTVWRGAAFDDISSVSGIAAEGESFFATEGDTLHAYRAADGKALWQAPLADQIGYCPECLSVSGGRVVVLTRDYTLQAFDAGTGQPAWSRRLAGYTDGFWIVGDSVLVIDQEPGEEYSLLQLNLSSGTVYRKMTPECTGESGYTPEHLSSNSTVVLDGDSAGSVYLFYGYSTSCIERWDLAGGNRLWQSINEKGYSPSQDYFTLIAGSTLYFAYDNFLWATDTASGQTRLVAQALDYELLPLAQAGERLIVRVKRTRGTTKFGLWGMDPAGGEKIWEHLFATGVPLDPPDKASGLVDSDQSVWTFRMGDGRMTVLEFQAQPNLLRLTTLDPQNGNTTDEKTLKLNIEDDYFVPTILGWRDPIFWMEVDSKIVGIDIGAGKIQYSYP